MSDTFRYLLPTKIYDIDLARARGEVKKVGDTHFELLSRTHLEEVDLKLLEHTK